MELGGQEPQPPNGPRCVVIMMLLLLLLLPLLLLWQGWG
jgi:hypothetical protein